MVSVIKSGYENGDENNPASFWHRLLAFVIDIVIVISCLLFSKILTIAPELANLLFPNQSISEFILSVDIFKLAFILLAFWLYYSLLESSKIQATIGKSIVGIQVVDAFGDQIRFGKASGRFFLLLLSTLLLGIGHLFALFTERKQTLHDRLSECEIVKGRASFFTEPSEDV